MNIVVIIILILAVILIIYKNKTEKFTPPNRITTSYPIFTIGAAGNNKQLQQTNSLTFDPDNNVLNTNSTYAYNIVGGVKGNIPYQDASGSTNFLSNPITSNQVLIYDTSYNVPSWISTSNLVGYAPGFQSGYATNLSGGSNGTMFYQSSLNNTASLLPPGSTNTVLTYDSTNNKPAWTPQSTITAGNAYSSTTANTINGGSAGNLLYQSSPGATSYVTNGSNGTILTYNSSTNIPTWTSPNSITFGSATTANNITGGSTGALLYQTSAGTTSNISAGISNNVLVYDTVNNRPAWTAYSSLSNVGSAISSSNILGGSKGNIHYQSGSNATTFLSNPSTTSNQVLSWDSANAIPVWSNANTLSSSNATTATNIAGGSSGALLYQTSAGSTSNIPAGSPGQLLRYGSNAPGYTSLATVYDASGMITIPNGNLTIGYDKDKYTPAGNNLSPYAARLVVAGDVPSGAQQLIVSSAAYPARQLLIGYDASNNYGVIQPIEQNVAFRNLNLNPYGGTVITGTLKPATIQDSTSTVGTNGQMLTSTGTGLSWQSPSSLSVNSATTASQIYATQVF